MYIPVDVNYVSVVHISRLHVFDGSAGEHAESHNVGVQHLLQRGGVKIWIRELIFIALFMFLEIVEVLSASRIYN